MTKTNERALLRSTALWAAFASLAAFGSAAHAQAPGAPVDPPQTEEQQQTEEQDIVVTGSRIRRDQFTSSSPIQIITGEQSSLEGLIDTTEILQGSPVASGSVQINNQFSNFVTEGGPGANTISLRGLGANRTLVLLNGRRLNPAGSRGQIGAVDTNVLPSSIIDRVEILKDGASSIYGSDAVAGVVNILTPRDLDGGVLEFTGNITEHGGRDTFDLNGAWGDVTERGQFLFAFDYYNREELTWGDRDFLSCAQDLVREDGPDGRVLDIIDPETGQSKCYNNAGGGPLISPAVTGGLFVVDPGAAAGGGFLPSVIDGFVNPFARPDRPGFRRVGHSFTQVNNYFNSACADPAFAAAHAYCATPDALAEQKEAVWRASQAQTPTDYPEWREGTADSPVERLSLFGSGALDIGAGAELYGEFLYNRRESSQLNFGQFFPIVFYDNPFGQPTFVVYKHRFDTSQEVDFFRGVAGLRGDFSGLMDDGLLSRWSYDVYVQAGYSDAKYSNSFVFRDRVDATTGPGAGPNCDPSFLNPAVSDPANCVAVDYFAAFANGAFTPQEDAFLFGNETGATTYDAFLASGTITGDLFQLPAGAVSLALGAEYRRETINDRPGINAQNDNYNDITSSGITQGTDSVRELFGEVELPILANKPLFESLTLNGSYRWTDYDSYDANDTYKLGLNWQITPEYRLRGSFGTSYRAPALFELFLGNQTGFQSQTAIDPCIEWELSSNPFIQANCAADGVPEGYTGGGEDATIITGGGAGILEEETSEATTFGAIWTPSWIDLSIAVDYFKIDVSNEVARFGAANIAFACYSSPDFPNNPFCNLLTRDTDPASPDFPTIRTINSSYVNLDFQTTEGIDLALRYEHEFSFGSLRLDMLATWTFEDSILFSAATATPTFEDFNGEIGDPDFTGQVDLRFDHNDWTFFWNADLVGKASNTEDFGGDVFGWRGSPFAAYYKQYAEFTAVHSGSIRYQSDTWTIQGGVQNIFDEPPPSVSTASHFFRIGNTALTSQHDIFGRRYFVTLARRW